MEELLTLYANNELELGKIEEQISIVIADLQNKQKELQDKNEEIKEQIKISMEQNEVKKYENDYISITYVAPTTRTTVDSKLLKEKYEDIYKECSKISNVKSSIRIKVKDLPKNNQNENAEKLPF
jgi:predicted phage-related endonuclease